MKYILIKSLICILILSCSAKNIVEDIATQLPVVTSIDLTKVIDDRVPVVINPGRFTKDTVRYYMPKVIQGTYAISDFGRYIDSLTAYDYQGNKLNVIKENDNVWMITNAKKLDRIEYLVNDTFDIENTGVDVPFSPSGTNIQSSNYLLNLHGFIGYFDALKENQYEVNVSAPSSMKRAAVLPKTGSTTNDDKSITTDKYFANKYFHITDSQMMYGDFEIEEFVVGDIKLKLSVYSPNKIHKAKKIKEIVRNIMQRQKAFLGDLRMTKQYDIFLYFSENKDDSPIGFGSLEHLKSTVIVFPEDLEDDVLASVVIDVISLEFFHIITPLTIHSEDIHNFDYNTPSFSKHLWIYEGFTEYFSTLFQIHQDVITEKEFFNKMMKKIQISKEFEDNLSFTKMGKNILEEPYASNFLNVYEKGALVAMCIDILIRENSEGKKGLLSLMKELSFRYNATKPFDDDKLIQEITELTYPIVGDFIREHVVGSKSVDYDKYFSKVGISLVSKKIETNYLENSGVLLFAGDQETGKVYFSENVLENSFWKEIGVQPDDEIAEINHKVLTVQNANRILGETYGWKTGDDLHVKLIRSEKEVLINTKIKKAFTESLLLKKQENSSDAQEKLRWYWLKG